MKGVPGLTSQLIPEEQAVREWGRKGEVTQQKIYSEDRSKGHETLMLSPVHSQVWWSWPRKGRSGEWLAWERRGHQRKGAGLHSEDSEWPTQGPLQEATQPDLRVTKTSGYSVSLPAPRVFPVMSVLWNYTAATCLPQENTMCCSTLYPNTQNDARHIGSSPVTEWMEEWMKHKQIHDSGERVRQESKVGKPSASRQYDHRNHVSNRDQTKRDKESQATSSKTHWQVRNGQMKKGQERTPKRNSHRCSRSGNARQEWIQERNDQQRGKCDKEASTVKILKYTLYSAVQKGTSQSNRKFQ